MIFPTSANAEPLRPVQHLLEALLANAPTIDSKPVIAATAQHVATYLGNAPASAAYYAHESGALTYALISARHAVSFGSAAVFLQNTTERRVEVQPQYQVAAILACLAGVLALPSKELRITVSGEQSEWDPLRGSLTDYLRGHSAYEVAWREKTTRVPNALHAAWIAAVILGPCWSSAIPDVQVFRELVASLLPDTQPSAGEAILTSIVRRAHLKAIADLRQHHSQNFIAPSPPHQVSVPVTLDPAGPGVSTSATVATPATIAAAAPEPQTKVAATQANPSNPMPATPARVPKKTPHQAMELTAALSALRAETASKPKAEAAPVDPFLNPWTPWAREVLLSMREAVAKRGACIRKMRIDEAGRGFCIGRVELGNWGVAEQMVTDELIRVGVLIERSARDVIVNDSVGRFLTQDGEFTVGPNEVPAERS